MQSYKKQILISGIISVFLVTTLTVTSTLISNPNFSLDIRNYAKQANEDDGGYANKQTVKPPSNQAPAKQNKPNNNQVEEEEATFLNNAQNATPVSTLTPSPTPTQTTRPSEAPLVNADKWADEPTISTVTMKDAAGNEISNEDYQKALKASAAPVVTYSYAETDKTGQTTAVTSSNDHNKVEKVTTNDAGITKTEVITVTPTNNTDYVKTNKVTITDEDNNVIDSQTSTTQTVTQTSSSILPSGNTVETKTIVTTDETGKVIDKVVVAAATPAPVVTNAQESQSFWQQLGNKFSDASNDTGLVGMGTGGLGMDGNTTAIPQSVITSKDPEAVSNYLVGSGLAGAAGLGLAATLVTAAITAPVISSALITASQATAANISAALATNATLASAVSYGSAAFTIGGTAAGAVDCQLSGGTGSLCNIVREGLFTGWMADPIGTTEQYSQGINTLIANPLKGFSSAISQTIENQLLGLDTLDMTSIALSGDKHADLLNTQTHFWQQGIVDEYGRVTGRPWIDVGDYFGKNTTLQTSTTPGIDVFEWVTSIANRTNAINPGSAVQLAGNWEPRTATAVVAYLNGDEAALASLLSKRLSLVEIEQLASNPERFASMLEGLDYVSLSGGALSQHADTAELARLSFSPENLTRLEQINPDIASQVNNIIDTTQNNPFSRLDTEQLTLIKDAQQALSLTPSQLASNINNNAHQITTNALLNPSDPLAKQQLSTLNNIIDADISFYGSNRSELLQTYVTEMFGSRTLIHGHTPASAIVSYAPIDEVLKAQLIADNYAGVYTDPGSGVTLFNIDQNLSSGMRVPFQVQKDLGILKGLPADWEGVVQLPTGLNLDSVFTVPTNFVPVFNP